MKALIITIFMMATMAAEHCDKSYQNFGKGVGEDLITQECIEYFKLKSLVTNRDVASDKSWAIYGYKNFVIVDNPSSPIAPEKNLILGEYTGLGEVVAVSLDSKNNEVIVLDKSGKLFFFSKMITGNVSAFRIIKSDELIGALDISYDEKRGVVLVLNPKKGIISAFDRSLGRDLGKKKVSSLEKVGGISIGAKSLSTNSEQRSPASESSEDFFSKYSIKVVE